MVSLRPLVAQIRYFLSDASFLTYTYTYDIYTHVHAAAVHTHTNATSPHAHINYLHLNTSHSYLINAICLPQSNYAKLTALLYTTLTENYNMH